MTTKIDKKETKTNKRFKLLKKEFIEFDGVKLYRIQALQDFTCRYSDVKKGDKGGYVDKEDVLIDTDTSWIFGEAKVYNNSTVRNNSTVDNSIVRNNSTVNNSTVDNSTVRNNSTVDNSTVRNNSIVNNSTVRNSTVDNSIVRNNSTVNNSTVNNSTVNNSTVNNSTVNNSTVDNSTVNNSTVDNSTLDSNMKIAFGVLKDVKNPFEKSDNSFIKYIASSIGIFPVKGKYLLYKKVNKVKSGVYSSCYDSSFQYFDGKIAEVKDYDTDITKSCSSGLHISHTFYWDEGDTLIACEVSIDDIITCVDGKLRVKKLKVIGEVQGFN